jgi:hypothetical protein
MAGAEELGPGREQAESLLADTQFGESDAATRPLAKEKAAGPLERNLASVNFGLIVIGILCITFMVHQGGVMLGQPTNAAPTLGLIVCLYSVVTGVAFFVRKIGPLKSNTKINAAGYPVPRWRNGDIIFAAPGASPVGTFSVG